MEKFIKKVEKAIAELGVNPQQAKVNNENQWDLQKGEAKLLLDLFKINDDIYFQCLAPVVKIPENADINFFEKILEKNHVMLGIYMTKFKNIIYLKNVNVINNATVDDILRQIKQMGSFAEDLIMYFNKI